jgi:hypothetical protein
MKEASRRFLPIGHLYERTTKTGNPYLTGMIAGQQVFLFPQEDGSWKVFIREDEPFRGRDFRRQATPLKGLSAGSRVRPVATVQGRSGPAEGGGD